MLKLKKRTWTKAGWKEKVDSNYKVGGQKCFKYFISLLRCDTTIELSKMNLEIWICNILQWKYGTI